MSADDFLAPVRPTDPLLWPAWYGCLHWALSEPALVEAFRAATGSTWRPGRTPIDQALDDATGAARDFFVAFATWMNAEVWGEPQEEA
jgi:hypothetical protein